MGDGFRRLARPVHHFLYGASRRQIHHDNPLVMRDTGADRERYASVDHRALRRRKTSGRIVAGASFVIAATVSTCCDGTRVHWCTHCRLTSQASAILTGNPRTAWIFAMARSDSFLLMTSPISSVDRKVNRLLTYEAALGLTWIRRLGFGRDAMDRIANHKTSTVTDVYDRHGYADEDKRIMAAVARHVIGLVEGAETSNVVRLR